MTQIELHIAVLQDEIQTLKSLLEPSGTGHLHTTIHVLLWRIDELKKVSNDSSQ